MPTINQLPTNDSPVLSDLIALYSSVNGDARKTSLNTLKNLVNPASTATTVTQYSAPVTGFSLSVAEPSSNTWLILTPAGTLATGTIVMPLADTCVDKQELLVTSTQTITTLTLSGNNGSLVGAPTTITAGTSFRLKFDVVMKTWYKV